MCLAIHSNPEVQNILPHLYGIIFFFLYSSIEYLTSGKFTVYLRFKIFVYIPPIRNILLSRKFRLALNTLSLKFSFSVFLFFNISFESEFGNPRFETLEKQNVFNFQLTFSAIVDFILGFVEPTAVKPVVLNLFLSFCFLMMSSFQTQLFKT